jgi:hypothetical protein
MWYTAMELATLCSGSSTRIQIERESVNLVAIDRRGERLVEEFDQLSFDLIATGFVEVDLVNQAPAISVLGLPKPVIRRKVALAAATMTVGMG